MYSQVIRLLLGSFITSSLPGTERGMEQTFGSTCHGAGRALSRAKSRRNLDFKEVGLALPPSL